MASAEIIHTSKRPDVEIDESSITKFVLSKVASYGDRPALIRSVSFLLNASVEVELRSCWQDPAARMIVPRVLCFCCFFVFF